MDIMKIIVNRRSIRKYKARDIPWNEVANIIQAARFTPCAGNIFNLRFIVVQDEAQKRLIAEASMQQHWMMQAPVHVVVVSEPKKIERHYGMKGRNTYTKQQAGAAAQTMLLTATALGIGSCWVDAFDQDRLRTICNIPPHIDVQMIITLGYADEEPEIPPKRSVEDVCNLAGFHGRIGAPKTGFGEWTPYIDKITGETKKAVKKGGEATQQKIERIVKEQVKKVADKVKESSKKKKAKKQPKKKGGKPLKILKK